MVLFLNLALNLIAILFLFWVAKTCWFNKQSTREQRIKHYSIAIISLGLLMFIHQALLPSYLPKGEVKRSTIPSFEQKDLEVRDITTKPMSGEERDLRREEAYQQPLPFIDKDVDTN